MDLTAELPRDCWEAILKTDPNPVGESVPHSISPARNPCRTRRSWPGSFPRKGSGPFNERLHGSWAMLEGTLRETRY